MWYHVSSGDFVQTQIEFSTGKMLPNSQAPQARVHKIKQKFIPKLFLSSQMHLISWIFILPPTLSLFYFSSGTKYLKYLFLFFNASSTINRKVFVAICCGFHELPPRRNFPNVAQTPLGILFHYCYRTATETFHPTNFPRQSIFLRCF